MVILAGDIGGTNSRLAVFDQQLHKLAERDFRNERHASLYEVIEQFLGQTSHRPDRACFGVAGPVSGGIVEMTNLGWAIDEVEIARSFKIEKVRLINDMVAHACGIEVLEPEQNVLLREGDERNGNRCIIAAGTGLGEAGLCFDHGRWIPFASEGGHCDFSPRDEQQDQLLAWMRNHVAGPVSWEHLLSGPGLKNVYEFLAHTADHLGGRLPPGKDGPREITAEANNSILADAAVELFSKLYLSEAGNLALKTIATGGVYIGGSIAISIQSYLKRDDLQESFWDKSVAEMSRRLKSIPIHLITSEKNGLHGAANAGRKL